MSAEEFRPDLGMHATKEQLRRAASGARDRLHAEWLAVQIGLAAETHPEELRSAIAKLFDMSATEEYCRRVMGVATNAQEQAREAAFQVMRLQEELDKAWKAIEALNYEIDQQKKIRRPA